MQVLQGIAISPGIALGPVVVLDLESPPEVDPRTQTLQPADDGSITLEAADAKITGSLAKLKGGYIGNWNNQSDWLSWEVNGVRAGNYNVELMYSCDGRTRTVTVCRSPRPSLGSL